MSYSNNFLSDCHKIMSAHYDNSLNIPNELRRRYRSVRNLDAQWENYLKYKFKYFKKLDELTPTIARREIITELESNAKPLIKFVSSWKKIADNEDQVYCYRCSQLPTEIVRNWYNRRISECDVWCSIRDSKMEMWAIEAREGERGKKLKSIYRKIGKKPTAKIEEDLKISTINKDAIKGHNQIENLLHQFLREPNAIYNANNTNNKIIEKCLTCCSETDSPDSPPGDVGSLEAEYISSLSLDLMKTLHSEGFSKTAVIRRFLEKIKEDFRCEVCDFLKVTDDYSEIIWSVATVTHADLSEKYGSLSKDQLDESIKVKESYARGIGITGSLLFLDHQSKNDIWHHIGSNDVQNDPRQSEKHKSAYEIDMYQGVLKVNHTINNFWMFPLYDEREELIGAFRVVNRLTKDRRKLQPGGWSFTTRVKLALVAQWFSSFLIAALPQMDKEEEFIEILERDQQIEFMMEKLRLNWVDKDVISGFLRLLYRNVSKKHESRSLGCCYFIVEAPDNSGALSELHNFPLLDLSSREIVRPYNKLDDYYDAVDPRKGAFIFDQNGAFLRVARLICEDSKGNSLKGTDAINFVTAENSKSISMFLSGESNNVVIYKEGEIAVEVQLSESTGKWHFRYPDNILKKMTMMAPKLEKSLLKMVCEAATELSRKGYGAIFVVGEVPNDALKYGPPNIRIDVNGCMLSQLSVDLLVDFSKMDGATFIDNKGKLTRTNSVVTPIKHPRRSKPLFNKGARHTAAEKIAKLAEKALVVVISENRGISLIANGGVGDNCCIKNL